MPIERKHRLALDLYRGQNAASWTACLRLPETALLDEGIQSTFVTELVAAAQKRDCDVAAWCLMPDHLHVVLVGQSAEADLWKAMVAFKQRTGYWLARNRPEIRWQKDFYDHVIRSDESLERHVRYAIDNPVRAGLVQYWQDYPWTGGTMVEALRTAT